VISDWKVPDGSGHRPYTSTRPHAQNAAVPLWTTGKYVLRLVGPVDMSFKAGG
jgi:hypothetical protein